MPQINHYLARDSAMIIAGHIYSPSRKQAQAWLDKNFPGHQVLLFTSARPSIQRGDYPVLHGEPLTVVDRGRPKGDGQKFVCSIRLTGKYAEKYQSVENKGALVSEAIVEKFDREANYQREGS
jgi:hypothetical protein